MSNNLILRTSPSPYGDTTKGSVLSQSELDSNFITLKAQEKIFMSLSGEGKRQAVEYMIRAKKALEDNGAIVLIVREGGVEE